MTIYNILVLGVCFEGVGGYLGVGLGRFGIVFGVVLEGLEHM